MSDTNNIAWIGLSGAIAGKSVDYLMHKKARGFESLKSKLHVTMCDNEVFCEIEKRPTDRLEPFESKSAEAIRRQNHRNLQNNAPSDNSQPTAIQKTKLWLEQL